VLSAVPLSLSTTQVEQLAQFLNQTIVNVQPFVGLTELQIQLATKVGNSALADAFRGELAFLQANPNPTLGQAINAINQVANIGLSQPQAQIAQFNALLDQVSVNVSSLASVLSAGTNLLGAFPSAVPVTSSAGTLLTNPFFFISLGQTISALAAENPAFDVAIANQGSTVGAGVFQNSFQVDAPESGHVLLQVVAPDESDFQAYVTVFNAQGAPIAGEPGSVDFDVEQNQSYTVQVAGLTSGSTTYNLSSLFVFTKPNNSTPPLPTFFAETPQGAILTPLGPKGFALLPVLQGSTGNPAIAAEIPPLNVPNGAGDGSGENVPEDEAPPPSEEMTLAPAYEGPWNRSVRIAVPREGNQEGFSFVETPTGETLWHTFETTKIVKASLNGTDNPAVPEAPQAIAAKVDTTHQPVFHFSQEPKHEHQTQPTQEKEAKPALGTPDTPPDDALAMEDGTSEGLVLEDD
jgi:hypothetical protein